MIPFASQRGSGKDLATHLLNEYDNNMVELVGIRGAIARDLHGAFKEWQVQAETLTKCQKYLYSLSINPDPAQSPLTRDQYMDYIRRAEKALGLAGQPRVVVFHSKYGREHCHVAWSRIDAANQRAIHLAFDKEKLMDVTRGFARDHGLTLPSGYEKSREVGQLSLYEQAQLQKSGLSQEDHKRQVTEAWRHSDDARSFVQALAERGYILATGKRPYVLVDLYGNMNALPKLIDDKSVRTKDVRAFLEKEFPVESLPTIGEAEKLVAAHLAQMEKAASHDDRHHHHDGRAAELKHAQQIRRRELERERVDLKDRQKSLRSLQHATHRAERDALRFRHLDVTKAVRLERRQNSPTGLAKFLGQVSGVNFVRERLRRHHDAQRLKEYLEQKAHLKARQADEQKLLAYRLKLQSRDIERREKVLDKIDARELAAMNRDVRRDERVMARGTEGLMPSLDGIAGLEEKTVESRVPDLLSAFEQAKAAGPKGPPDLMAAFEQAAGGWGDCEREEGAGSSLDRARSPDAASLRLKMKKDFDRER